MRRRLALVFALLLTALCPARASDARGAAEVWSRFVESLRRGDYATAHGLFSSESRAAMPYREFVEEYGPLSPARELVLARAESGSTRLEENWARLEFDGVLPATGRRFRIEVALVLNDGRWGLVAARNESVERLEASVRRVMERAVTLRGDEVMSRLREMAASEPALQYYRLGLEDGRLVAEPLRDGLRVFHVGRDGVARTGRSAPEPVPAPAAPPPIPEPQPPPLVNGLPELSEPPPLPADLGEMPEPPSPVRAPPRRDAPEVRLPDSIE